MSEHDAYRLCEASMKKGLQVHGQGSYCTTVPCMNFLGIGEDPAAVMEVYCIFCLERAIEVLEIDCVRS